jgi:hypothetical protein
VNSTVGGGGVCEFAVIWKFSLTRALEPFEKVTVPSNTPACEGVISKITPDSICPPASVPASKLEQRLLRTRLLWAEVVRLSQVDEFCLQSGRAANTAAHIRRREEQGELGLSGT